MRFLSVVILLWSSTLCWASCPTPDDAKNGIYAKTKEGRIWKFTTRSDGTVSLDEDLQNGTVVRHATRGIIFGLNRVNYEDGVIDASSRKETTFTADVGSFFPIKSGSSWQGSEKTYSHGILMRTQKIAIDVGMQTEVKIASCNYSGLPISMTRSSKRGTIEIRGYFLNDLGFAIYESVGGDDWSNDFTVLSFTKTAP